MGLVLNIGVSTAPPTVFIKHNAYLLTPESSAASKIRALYCRYDNSLSMMQSCSKTIRAEQFLCELQSKSTAETNKIKVFTHHLKALKCIHSLSAPRPYFSGRLSFVEWNETFWRTHHRDRNVNPISVHQMDETCLNAN
jgi:hypothetical protein